MSVAETALREFREETRCVYDAIAPESVATMPVVSLGGFRSYAIEVPYVPAQDFTSRPAPAGCSAPEYRERGPWAWIPLAAIEAVLDDGSAESVYVLPEEFVPPGATRTLWSASAKVLEKAIAEGVLPSETGVPAVSSSP